jgi:hypothetical protein
MRFPWILVALIFFVGTQALAEQYVPYDVFLDDWREYSHTLAPLTPAERRAKSVEYLEKVSWDQALYYCRVAEVEGKEENSSVFGMLDTRLRLGLGEAGALVELISNPDYCLACQKAAVKFISSHKDSILRLPESHDFGRAMLSLVDSGTREPGISKQLEQAAAALCADADIMQRMMSYSKSEDRYQVFQAVQMLGGSRDPQAADSLQAVALSLVELPAHRRALSRAVAVLAGFPGADLKYFDFIHSLYLRREGSYTEGLLRDALSGLARTGNPRFYEVLLSEYDDGETGIIDATHLIEDSDLKRKYWNLWFFARLAEPGILRLLESNAPEALVALEVLDRESRFGLPMLREEILLPLEAWGRRQGGDIQVRSKSIAGRFRSYSDPTKP